MSFRILHFNIVMPSILISVSQYILDFFDHGKLAVHRTLEPVHYHVYK